ncbi:MAG: hypothetical protein CL677_08635 [Bdellovibrionaceae bacterium]|nr:hypothetical protein [Pseudobdellovibrionaceae bacterium]|tara:strand:- start:2678 stop:3118 length:441 start_codon:yes stop_codon:yes gene_type:complete
MGTEVDPFKQYTQLGPRMLQLPVPPIGKYGPVANENGVTFYYVNHFKWSEVQDAQLHYFHGVLPYIKVKRIGSNKYAFWWWVALYLGGFENFKADVLEHAPAENPFVIELLKYTDRPSKKKVIFYFIGVFIVEILFFGFLFWLIDF